MLKNGLVMEGYYTKNEAANALGVSVRQVNNYLSEKHLRVVYQGKRAWIPKEDVQKLYARATWGMPAGPGDFEELQGRIAVLEKDLEVLKLGLGFGPGSKIREAPELLLLRNKFIDLLTQDNWTNRQISSVADDLISVHEQELLTLYNRVGPIAWIPLDDLASRMVTYLEAHPEYPTKGLEVLRSRLIRARDRFLGLVYVASKIPARRSEAAATLLGVLQTAGPVDDAVLGYILNQK